MGDWYQSQNRRRSFFIYISGNGQAGQPVRNALPATPFTSIGRDDSSLPFFLGARLLAKSRAAFAVRLAVVLQPSLITRFIVLTSAAAGLFAFAPRLMQPLFGRRLTLWSICQRIDADVVFLVGTPDFDGAQLCNPLGN